MENLPVLNERQNVFIKEYITNGNNGTEAYRVAYDLYGSTASCSVGASKLLKHPKIIPWINYYRKNLQQHIESEIKYSIDDAFRECDELKTIALESVDKEGRPNVSVAMKAVETKIKLKGLFKDNISVNNNMIVQMGEVEIDGSPLELHIGDSLPDDKDETAKNS